MARFAWRWYGPFTAVAALATFAACTGHVGIAGSAGPTAGSSGGSVGDPPDTSDTVSAQPLTAIPDASPCVTGTAPGPRALRRLSASELAATIKDLFNDPAVPLASVFNDPVVLGFSNDAHALVVQGLGAQQLQDQAEAVAHWAVTNHLSALSSCTTTDATCRQSFIRQFGKRVHRAPLSDGDVASYDSLFTAESSFADGAEAVTSAMLQSPYFLYKRELGAESAGGYDLSAYEVASAISYFLTGSMPDVELMAAADSGALATPAGRDAAVDRLLQSPRGHDAVMSFMSGWFGLPKLSTVAKDDNVFKLTPTLRVAMLEETRNFIDNIFYAQRGTLTDLLTSNHTFVNSELATHYGVPGVSATGSQMTPVTLTLAQRDFGLLAQGSIMTIYATSAESSPVQRGKLVRMRLLCEDLPPPPANLDTMLKPPKQATTTREHFIEHRKSPVCATCHTRMDPIGFGFEHYDAFGRHRDNDGGQPVDATGTIIGAPEGDVAFDGVLGLTKYLTTNANQTVNACMVRYWSYFAFGSASWNEDQCTYEAIAQQASQNSSTLQSVVKAITHTSRFAHRTADP